MPKRFRMQYHSFLSVAVLVATAAIFTQPVSATIIIDQFSASQAVQIILPDVLSQLANSTGIAAPFAVGGNRVMALYATEGEEDDLFRLRVSSAGSGTLRFATDPSVRGKGLISYNGTTAPNTGVTAGQFNPPPAFALGSGSGGAALDLTEGGSNTQIRVRGYADNGGLPIVFTMWHSSTKYARGTIFMPASNNATFSIHALNFSGFNGFGLLPGEDVLDVFQDVRAITVELDATAPGITPGTDAVLDYYLATSVPEPGTYMLIGSALLGLGLLRRISAAR